MGETYTPPILAYPRKYGPSVTGGYVYRGKRDAPLYGALHLLGTSESRRIWALTQADRHLVKVRQIGESPQKIASFGVDSDGELLLVGYEGTIFRLVLEDSDFGPRRARLRLLRDGATAAARVSVVGSDGKPYGPTDAAIRATARGESYFYAEGAFEVELPPGPAKLTVSGGLETIPQTVTVDAGTPAELPVSIQPWIDMGSRGWYSGDSHVHLHTGGPIRVTAADALVAARAEGVNYVNLCASNNLGDDIRDAEAITGKPVAVSTGRNLLVFGEEMRSTIYGHMQFFGIRSLVRPQYTGFDGTPHRHDFPANHAMASEAVRQGAVVTYGHPLFAGQPFPFEDDPSKPSGRGEGAPRSRRARRGPRRRPDVLQQRRGPLGRAVVSSAQLWIKALGVRRHRCPPGSFDRPARRGSGLCEDGRPPDDAELARRAEGRPELRHQRAYSDDRGRRAKGLARRSISRQAARSASSRRWKATCRSSGSK